MTPRKPMRPRLERCRNSYVCGVLDSEGEIFVHIDSESIGAKDCTRLRKFLEKCERYLEARKERK